MEKFIKDHTGVTIIRISHISTVSVVPRDCERNLSSSCPTFLRLYAVEAQMKNKQKYFLKTGFKDKESAIKWMNGLGFLKENKKEKKI